MNLIQNQILPWLIILFVLLGGCHKNIIKPPPYTPFHDYPAFSPDSKTIAFFSYGSKPSEMGIYLLDINSGDISFLVQGGRTPDWSPTDSIIAYVGVDDQIYTIHLTTHHISQLTTEGWNRFPNFSPNGKRIAYDEISRGIWLMDANGENSEKLNVAGEDPHWSPTGEEIVYMGSDGGGGWDPEIWIADSSGKNQRKLTSNDRYDSAPAWSPDGAMIAWSSQISGKGYSDIWVMNSDGTNQRCLVLRAKDPDWSPDSQKLTFVAPDNKGKEVIWIINKDGLGRKQITF